MRNWKNISKDGLKGLIPGIFIFQSIQRIKFYNKLGNDFQEFRVSVNEESLSSDLGYNLVNFSKSYAKGYTGLRKIGDFLFSCLFELSSLYSLGLSAVNFFSDSNVDYDLNTLVFSNEFAFFAMLLVRIGVSNQHYFNLDNTQSEFNNLRESYSNVK
jgi:hypothetical protein